MNVPNVELLDYNWGYRKLAVANERIAELEQQLKTVDGFRCYFCRCDNKPYVVANPLGPHPLEFWPCPACRPNECYSEMQRCFRENAATIQRLTDELRIAREPDMFWDADDPERCEDCIREIIYDRGLEVAEIATATHGPTFFAFLTGDDEKEPEVVHVFGTREEAEESLSKQENDSAK